MPSRIPTFLAVCDGEVVESLRGAESRGLAALAEKHAVVGLQADASAAVVELPAEASA